MPLLLGCLSRTKCLFNGSYLLICWFYHIWVIIKPIFWNRAWSQGTVCILGRTQKLSKFGADGGPAEGFPEGRKLLCEYSLMFSILGDWLPGGGPVITTSRPRGPVFLCQTLAKPQAFSLVPFHTCQASRDFQREIDFKNKGNQKENTPRGEHNPTNARIHMNKKQKHKMFFKKEENGENLRRVDFKALSCGCPGRVPTRSF